MLSNTWLKWVLETIKFIRELECSKQSSSPVNLINQNCAGCSLVSPYLDCELLEEPLKTKNHDGCKCHWCRQSSSFSTSLNIRATCSATVFSCASRQRINVVSNCKTSCWDVINSSLRSFNSWLRSFTCCCNLKFSSHSMSCVTFTDFGVCCLQTSVSSAGDGVAGKEGGPRNVEQIAGGELSLPPDFFNLILKAAR